MEPETITSPGRAPSTPLRERSRRAGYDGRATIDQVREMGDAEELLAQPGAILVPGGDDLAEGLAWPSSPV